MNIGATLVGQTVAFIFFVWFCMKYVWPPLMSTIEERQKLINKGIEDAEKAKNDLINAQKKASDYLKEAKVKANKIIEEANTQRSKIIDKAKIEAEAEARSKIEQAKSEIQVSAFNAKKELISQISFYSVMGAEKILKSTINGESQDALIKELIKDIHKEEYV